MVVQPVHQIVYNMLFSNKMILKCSTSSQLHPCVHVRDLGEGDAGVVRDTDPLAHRLGPPGLGRHRSWLTSDT